MGRQKFDYEPLCDLIRRDGGVWKYEDREGGWVLIEPLDEDVRIEWVHMPEHRWFGAMAKDERRTLGIPMLQVHGFLAEQREALRLLRVNISNRGLDEGWTRIGAFSPSNGAAEHFGFDSLAVYRQAVRDDALRLKEALSRLLES